MLEYKKINTKKDIKSEIINSIIKDEFKRPSNKEKKNIQKELISAIENALFHKSLNLFMIGLTFDYNAIFDKIRRKGVFRYSKYISKRNIIKGLITEIIKVNEQLSFIKEKELGYLNSILNYYPILNTYKDLNKDIISRIRKFNKKYKGKSFIKTLLAYTDYLFLINHYPKEHNSNEVLLERTKEDISSAVSYLIYFYYSFNKEKETDTVFISDEFIINHKIEEIIILACNLEDFKEFEIYIDHFNYKCINEEHLKIVPPTEKFEKSIRAGYIRNQVQEINDNSSYLKDIDKEALSIDELIDKVFLKEKFNFFFLKETYGIKRYVIQLPQPIFKYIQKEFLGDNFFLEEIIFINKMFKEHLFSPKNLKNYIIKDNLTLLDVIKINRVFYFLQTLFSKKLLNIEKINYGLIINSLLPVFKEEAIYDLLDGITTKSNIKTFLDIKTWKPNMDVVFDLQCHYMLYLSNHFIIPFSLANSSNTIRNILVSENKQNNPNNMSDGVVDVLVDALYNTFIKASIKVYKQIPIPKTDIDLFSIIEDTIYIFECKNSVSPSSIFDLRTSYDYIVKAEKQLNYIQQLYDKGVLLDVISKKCNIDLSKISNIKLSIVINNRLFIGNDTFKFPIRYISELSNFIINGTMVTEEGVFRIWEKEIFHKNDLSKYLSKESEIINLLLNSLSSKPSIYNIPKPKIEFLNYYLDFKKAKSIINDFSSKFKKFD